MANVYEILGTWDTEGQYRDWYALDELRDDGTMMRVTVGELADVQRTATHMMFGGDDAGTYAFEPFYRVTLVGAKSARLFFNACAGTDTPSYAAGMLSVSDVAERTGRTRQAVLDLIRRGRLHAEMIMGEWRVMGQAVHEFKPYTK